MTSYNKNTNLGLYDIVMAMSESSINYLLKGLLDEDVIKDTWSVRLEYNEDGDKVETVFINDCDNIEAFDQKLIQFQKGFFAKIEEYDLSKEDKENFKKWDTLSAKEKRELEGNYNLTEEQLDNLSKYPYPIYIKIKEKFPHSVLFAIRFKSGVYKYTTMKAKEKSIKLDGMVYVFSVDLKKVSKSYKEFTDSDNIEYETKIKINAQIEANEGDGIKAENSTIESLFLDLGNADFVNYDDSSIFPPGLDPDIDFAQLTDFQKVLGNYFNSSRVKRDKDGNPILDKDGNEIIENPYVLGHCITLPDLEEREDAAFQPRSLDFSTSFSKKENCSSLNYLMMVEKVKEEDVEKLSEDSHLGILNSLIDQDMTSEMDGTLGIDGNIFYRQYLGPDLIPGVLKVIGEVLEDQKKDFESDPSSGGGFFTNKVVKRREFYFKEETGFQIDDFDFKKLLEKPCLMGKQVLTMKSIENNSSKGRYGHDNTYTREKRIELVPKVEVSFENNAIELKVSIQIDIIYIDRWHNIGSTGNVNEGSNTGEESNYQNGGKFKTLYITLTPGINGMFDVTAKHDDLEEELFVKIYDTKNAIKKVIEYINPKKSYFKIINYKEFIKKIGTKINNVGTLPEIVLPISNVYTYKNITLSNEDVITIESAYMPHPTLNNKL